MPQIQKLSVNTNGRDFVCGDIHGSYSCVERFLHEINFDVAHDRLICVGDLIDRGPESEKCLDLLNHNWFFSVKGNHEFLMESSFENPETVKWWIFNGGAWGIAHLIEQSENYEYVKSMVSDKIRNLPYVISVEKKSGGLFHVMHAELISFSREKVTDETFSDWKKLQQFATRRTEEGETVLWGRFIFSRMFRKELSKDFIDSFKTDELSLKLAEMFNPKLSHIYSGHTVVQHPIQFYGQTNIDTMAYASYEATAPKWCGLTVTEPETGKFWKCSDTNFQQIKPFIIGV